MLIFLQQIQPLVWHPAISLPPKPWVAVSLLSAFLLCHNRMHVGCFNVWSLPQCVPACVLHAWHQLQGQTAAVGRRRGGTACPCPAGHCLSVSLFPAAAPAGGQLMGRRIANSEQRPAGQQNVFFFLMQKSSPEALGGTSTEVTKGLSRWKPPERDSALTPRMERRGASGDG